jgi:hypothetical protein
MVFGTGEVTGDAVLDDSNRIRIVFAMAEAIGDGGGSIFV